MTYNFTLFYSAQNDINAIIDQWVQFNLSSYYLTAGKEKEQLKIKKQLFSDYPFKFWKVQLTGDLIYSANLTLQGDSSNEFLVNFPPANGECDVDPKNGTTSDVFSFNCSNWMDSEGFVTNYVFYGKCLEPIRGVKRWLPGTFRIIRLKIYLLKFILIDIGETRKKHFLTLF